MNTDLTASQDTALRSTLLKLARIEEDRAAIEASAAPYWIVCPPSVQGHRFAASVLRDAADAYLANTEASRS